MDALDLFKSTLSLGPTTRSNPDPLWEWEEIRRSHHAAHSALTVDQSHLLMVQVFSRARLQHPDLDEFVGFMVVATKALVPAWNAISLGRVHRVPLLRSETRGLHERNQTGRKQSAMRVAHPVAALEAEF